MGRNIFNSVLMPKVDSNSFDLSHDVKTSFQMGEVVPTCVLDCVPGDSFTLSAENMLRFVPLVSPVMHQVKVDTRYFFVPTRLIWPEWEKWITGESDVEAPYISVAGAEVGSLADYIGIPTGEYQTTIKTSPMALAAYVKIWNDYYRDQNLQTPYDETLTAGNNSLKFINWLADSPLRRAWEHDYFTSALPFAQKGDSVSIPLVSQDNLLVEYTYDGAAGVARNTGLLRDADNGNLTGNAAGYMKSNLGPAPFAQGGMQVEGSGGTGFVAYDPNGTLSVDVQADATDINTLRKAFSIQAWLEKNARGGTRYIENILAHFGVKSSDTRLNRPEYIGGTKQNMVISEVLATAQSTDDGVAVGSMAGHGISVGGGNTFNYRCEEHGFIIGVINVQPTTAYQQGMPRMHTRLDRLNYLWPSFANLGEQEVLQKELYARSLTPEAVFGYVPRYAEYRFMNSRVSGEMRDSLAFWHMGRIFENEPALNQEFIESNPTTRIFAVTDPAEDHIIAHIFNSISARRKLPRYGIPQL
ncbi:MAG: major capsid protein [Microviridae sp.]|nr:MAG: major capsid protein [Microviridae sp.]